MNQLQQCLAMGGYGPYVWPAYGLACIVLLMNFLSIRLQRQRTRRSLQQWFKRQ
ncbi:heme exporter protein CcmD [Legionella micdadei]|uniref:Heme exporter protein D n=1 Tax=Legionella micdadei TaxID=451 RepID=A0A1G5FFP8_LEGMI|nr:heme exporter protein CcmD [Legionella micdadei]ARG97231.1 heme exporter protein CcmD [Legionella micdadei]ARH00512.1 heme exporter protein CcmD [Legionella micdadei]KTD29162.1 heme exporter protein CcmD [Legionella micdadei]NSL17463.1 heme exporter protein CcmD [Legionella micdadei]SCY37468.1 heme exporter protein D [Legionella micdadei]